MIKDYWKCRSMNIGRSTDSITGLKVYLSDKIKYEVMKFCKGKFILHGIYHKLLSDYSSKILEDWEEITPTTKIEIEQRIDSLERAVRLLQDVDGAFEFKKEEDSDEYSKEDMAEYI